MSGASKIWIIDDEPAIRLAFRFALIGAGYEVTEYDNGRAALEQFVKQPPALIILDVKMPDLDGWQTLEHLRRDGRTPPVLMITGANDLESRVRGLDLGADDYIGKPCAPSELLARVRALLRRAPPVARSGELRFADLCIDLASRTATKGGAPLNLTRTDYALLSLLHAHLGKPVSRELILQQVWEVQTGQSHALDTHLWRLRRKLGDTAEHGQWIQNCPGLGYMMTAAG